MKELTNQGIGTQVKRGDPVFPNEEQALWDSGVFNIDSSTGLSYIGIFRFKCEVQERAQVWYSGNV